MRPEREIAATIKESVGLLAAALEGGKHQEATVQCHASNTSTIVLVTCVAAVCPCSVGCFGKGNTATRHAAATPIGATTPSKS